MNNQTDQSTNGLDTSQQIKHVFGCAGEPMHLTPGFKLLQSGDITRCPDCGAQVHDVSDTPIGQAYLAFGRPDLGERP